MRPPWAEPARKNAFERRQLTICSGQNPAKLRNISKSHILRHFSFAPRNSPVHKGALRGTAPAVKTRKPGSRTGKRQPTGPATLQVLESKEKRFSKKLVDKMPR
jgi:hypothetical protein